MNKNNRDAMYTLMRFGAACLEEHRESSSDLDGDWLQERATECGLLEFRTVTEGCGPECQCEDFPSECLFPRSGVARLLADKNLAEAWKELIEATDTSWLSDAFNSANGAYQP